MRKKLDTRFPAARIKKIMQTDEDVGKIASAVPVLVSKALELFLQDLCDKTYGITLQRGMKTMSSQHLKQCVQSCNHYDFLRELVSKVPDLGSGDAGSGDGRLTHKRRTTDDEEIEEQLKRPRVESAPAYNASSSTNASSSSGGTVRGRGRPRGSGRGGRRNGAARGGAEREIIPHYEEDLGISSPAAHNHDSSKETEIAAPVHNFDLNVDFNENNASSAGPVRPTDPTTTGPQNSVTVEDTQDEYFKWSAEDMKKKMAVDPVQFALTHQKIDDGKKEEEEEEEEDDDYDNE